MPQPSVSPSACSSSMRSQWIGPPHAEPPPKLGSALASPAQRADLATISAMSPGPNQIKSNFSPVGILRVTAAAISIHALAIVSLVASAWLAADDRGRALLSRRAEASQHLPIAASGKTFVGSAARIDRAFAVSAAVS